jgi:hypothetical protein
LHRLIYIQIREATTRASFLQALLRPARVLLLLSHSHQLLPPLGHQSGNVLLLARVYTSQRVCIQNEPRMESRI